MKHSEAVPAALWFLRGALRDLEGQGLLRRPAPVRAPGARVFCSNDYLGLADRPGLAVTTGAGASRLVSGDHTEHVALERAVADWLGAASALVFTSGYAANVGILSALAEAGDLIVSDSLNHASLIDGARLSRARVVVVPHLDVAAVAAALAMPRTGRAWVVTESYFSMDADTPDLPALRRVCDDQGAGLIVDEAHAVGVLGPEGRGLCAAAGVVPDVLVGTFGKAFGAGGAFVAGCSDLREWLWNRARSFVFSTGLSPASAAGARSALEVAITEPSRRATTALRATELRDGLHALGIRPLGFGHIVPWVVGDAQTAVDHARAISARGALVQAIRPPSVPMATARLRLTVTAQHSASDVTHLLGAIEETVRCAVR